MGKNNGRRLTKEFCIEEVKKYASKSDVYKNDQAVYTKLSKFGLLDELFPNGQRKPYTYEECKLYASKCQTRNEFKKRFNGPYSRARSKNWLDSITGHMTKVGTLKKRLIYLYVFSDNSVYVGLTFNIKKRIEGHKNKGTVYKKSKELNEWIEPQIITDYIDVDLAVKKEEELILYYKSNGFNVLNTSKGGELGAIPLNRISVIDILNVVKDCDSRWDFQQRYSKHYSQAKRDGILDDVCKDLPHLRPERKKEEIAELVKDIKTYKEFYTNYPKEYEYAIRKGWVDDITKHLNKKRYEWSYEEISEIVKHYTNRTKFLKENRGAYESARQKGWLDKLFSKIPSLRSNYSLEDIKVIINNNDIKGRTHLSRYNHNAYEKARRNKWLDILFPNK
jgi:predicted GIY-YIG superfamily endonuclease